MKNQGELALPGDDLAVIEEFISGEGVYEEDGVIRSAVVGKIFYDMINRKGNVISLKKPKLLLLKKAKYLIGRVDSVKEDLANVSIYSIEDKLLNEPLSGILHISQVSNKYIQSITDAVKPSDIIKVKPITFSIPIALTIRQKDLGVILARCSRCGAYMVKQDEEHLKCPVCGNVESRKIGTYIMVRK